jgi:chromosome segregation ATPase
LPRIKADILEKAVWKRLKAVLSNSDTLRQSMRDGLAQLKERRSQLSKETGTVDKQLEVVLAKKERLGLVFTDGAITRDVYEKRLNELTRQEKELLKARDNLNPQVRGEIQELELAIASLEKTLESN